jgi:acyl carrier protein
MISDKLKKVILGQLDLDDWDMQDDTIASTVPGWDSLSHARIICAIEDEFRIRFLTREIVRLQNVGELQKLVDEKTQAGAGAGSGPGKVENPK